MSLSDTAFISIIIPVLNDADQLVRCLHALEGQTYPADQYEVIVVDNGSAQPMDVVVQPYPHARLLVEHRRSSYAARNRGLLEARGRVIGFTDADCTPAPDWIEQGVEAVRSTPNCGLIAGRIDLSFRDDARPTPVEQYETLVAFPQEAYLTHSHFGVTANLFTLRAVIDHVGPFDSRLASNGDREWGVRVYQAGYYLRYADEVRVVHPARHRLRDVLKKARRVIGGDIQVKRQSGYSTFAWLHDVQRELTPPLRRTWNIMQNTDLGSKTLRLQIIGVLWLVRYVRAWERIRHPPKFRLKV